MTHTERVHVLFGLGLVLLALCALREAWSPGSRARFVWPALAFLIGWLLFVPVETQGRTYQPAGWWEVLWGFVPDAPSRWIPDWIAMAAKRHVWQHKIGAAFAMAAGVIELLRARERLRGPAWGFALPASCIGAGVAFGVHGGTTGHLPHGIEQLHHHVLGLALAAAGVSLALVRAGRLHGPWWRGLWAMLVLAVGLDIALFYRLAPGDRRPEGHPHESLGAR